MAIVPNFLLKKLYVQGSLRQLEEGVAFDIINSIGPGIITRINSIKLGNLSFLAHQIGLKLGEDRFMATDVSDANPVTIFLNQTLTCILKDHPPLDAGTYAITVDLSSKEAGKIVVTVQDSVPA
jgi:hypothetical protein